MFISAGEVSGDRHAAAVARELRDRIPGIRLVGLGGSQMESAGVELIEGLDRLAVMGRGEVLKRLPFFIGLERRVKRALVREDVRLFLPVDYPGLNLRLARVAHRQGRRVLYFIAPQVWAWKEARAKQLSENCDRVLTVLPFEARVLERYNTDVAFVGHPLLDNDHMFPGDEPRSAPGESRPSRDVVGIFPGSREQEVRSILPVFAAAAELLRRRRPDLAFLVARPPHLPESLYREYGLATADAPQTLSRAYTAMTKSGTVTLELALAGVPMVVGYRTSRYQWAVARRLVKVPSIVLVNLVADDLIVPELLQDALTAERVATTIEPLLADDSPARRNMLRGFGVMRERLGDPGCAKRVADHAVELIA